VLFCFFVYCYSVDLFCFFVIFTFRFVLLLCSFVLLFGCFAVLFCFLLFCFVFFCFVWFWRVCYFSSTEVFICRMRLNYRQVARRVKDPFPVFSFGTKDVVEHFIVTAFRRLPWVIQMAFWGSFVSALRYLFQFTCNPAESIWGSLLLRHSSWRGFFFVGPVIERIKASLHSGS